MTNRSLLRRLFSAIWNGITRLRLALANILFLLMLVLLYVVYVGESPEPLPGRAALLLNPAGVVVDEKSQVSPLQALMGNPSPEDREVLLQDIIDAIDLARDDPAINSLVMELDWLVHIGISKTQEIVRALQDFSATGKPVVAVADFYTQDQYLLASYADAVIMHPLGTVALEGYSSYRNYFREALEKLSISMHVFRAGEYKSAAEHFLRDDMSPGEREITARWLGLLWDQYTATVETRRELQKGAVDLYVNRFAERLEGHGGDAAAMARDAGLVDHLFDRLEANDYLAELVGATDDEGLYEAVPFEHYLFRKHPLRFHGESGPRVAVITAQGMMLPGDQPPGTIGGDSLAQLVQTTAAREDVKAIVLRIDSGGGSVFAAEVIRQQLLDARASGIPVVVSMGGIAASGGYYIAAQADEIWATPTTITGSIGVYAAFPTVDGLLQRLGVHTDGVGTTALAGSLRSDRPLDPQIAAAVGATVDFTYRKFLQIVAEGRGMSTEEADTLGQGRVWGAPDALELGLVDSLGSLEDAVDAAAARAELEDYEVEFVQPYRSPGELFLQQLAERLGSLGLWAESVTDAAVARLLQPAARAVAELDALQDPKNLYMRCVPCAVGL